MIDVVIPTLNRHEKVKELIRQLLPLQQQGRIARVIVVDSSDSTLSVEGADDKVKVIRSSHKNQPYQRWLGAKASSAQYILFLDDDMEILDATFCEELQKISERGVAGANLTFTNDNVFLQALAKSVVPAGGMAKWLRGLSGYGFLKANKVWFAGIKGIRIAKQSIEYVNGGAFMARREWLYKNMSAAIFDVYEKGLGKGEDVITGFALAQLGEVVACAKVFFYHNDQKNSIYSINHYRFNQRVAFSRLFLSLEYARIRKSSGTVAWIHYQWFVFWRLVGICLNCVARPRKTKIQGLIGYIAGVTKANLILTPKYLFNRENNEQEYWNREVSSDLQAAS